MIDFVDWVLLIHSDNCLFPDPPSLEIGISSQWLFALCTNEAIAAVLKCSTNVTHFSWISSLDISKNSF